MSVEVGEETEPILLNIAPPDGGDSLIRGFSKRMLLDEVTNMACEEFNLERSCIIVQRLVGKGTEIKMISLSLSRFSMSPFSFSLNFLGQYWYL